MAGIDVVTAGGELVHANEAQHADLFWAARGSGPGFFGVITRFHLRTYPAEPMFHDTRVFSLEDLEPLLPWLHDVMPRLGVAVEPVMAATRVGRLETVLLLHTTFTGDPDPLLDTVPCRALEQFHGPTTIAEENVVMSLQNPEGYRYAADSQWTDADAATLYPLLRDVYAELPTEHSFSIWYGWAPTRELGDMAFSLERDVYLATYAIWSDAADDDRHREWVHGHQRGSRKWATGSISATRTSRGARTRSWPSPTARAWKIRSRLDPDGVFVSYEMGR